MSDATHRLLAQRVRELSRTDDGDECVCVIEFEDGSRDSVNACKMVSIEAVKRDQAQPDRYYKAKETSLECWCATGSAVTAVSAGAVTGGLFGACCAAFLWISVIFGTFGVILWSRRLA